MAGAICVLLIMAPLALTQPHTTQQQVTSPSGLEITTTTTSPSIWDYLPWEKVLALMGCISLAPILLTRWLIGPVVQRENNKQLTLMREMFASMDTFRSHLKAYEDFKGRVERHMEAARRDRLNIGDD